MIYIVKENRTYDQVLGDLPQGNGSPALALFGQSVTPNLHALAQRFVLLDNFYDCAEASGDGWPWSTQGIANEYVIKNLPYNYSGRGRNYDYEGSNNNYPTGGFPATDPYGNSLVGPNSPFVGKGGPAITDVAEAPGGHIWDDVLNHGLSFRNYGAFTSFGVGSSTGTTNDNALLPYGYPGGKNLRPVGIIPTLANGTHTLTAAGNSDFDMRGYDQNYADSEAPYYYANNNTFPAPSVTQGDGTLAFPPPANPTAKSLFAIPTSGHYQSPSRVSELKREINEMMAVDPTGSAVPNFIMLKYSNDHTQGFRTSTGNSFPKGTFTNIHSPKSAVADNDYAVGQTVDFLSNQYPQLWQHTAIFVIEDDAQDGPDHVDSHRSTCFVLSPFIKQGSVDHTFYNTDSVLHTMELLLGLPPMSQYDAVATPILDFDTTAGNATPYAAILPPLNVISDLNPSLLALRPGTVQYHMAQLSNTMDFVHPDSAPAHLLNDIVWKSVKGVHARVPAPRHTLTEAQLHFGLQPPAALKAVKGQSGAKALKTIARDDD